MINTILDQQKGKKNRSHWIVFFVILIAELIGAYYLVYQNNVIFWDAFSRTANGYYVAFIQPHKLASIGLVWNPLPSLVQIPILLLKNLWPPLATYGFSGCIMTAVSAAIGGSYLYRLFDYFKINKAWSIVLIALFAFHPFIFLYGLNGLSEMSFFVTIIITVGALSKWIVDRKSSQLIVIAAALVVGFLCRYEAMPICLGLAIGIFFIVFFMQDTGSAFKEKTLNMKFHYYISTCLIVFLPVAYMIFLWIFLNWTTMGDPFFFLSSDYSNSAIADTSFFPAECRSVISKITYVCEYVGERLFPYILLFVIVTIERIATRRIFKADYWAVFFVVFIIIAFHTLMLISGKSFGWIRFFSFALPICFAWVPYELYHIKGFSRNITAICLSIALVISSAGVINQFNDSTIAPEEHGSFYEQDINRAVIQFEPARVINESYFDGRMLLDSRYLFGVIMNADHPENLVINTNDEFMDALEKPWEYDIRYILVLDPDSSFYLGDVINMKYPDLYYEGAEWAELREEINGHRIYEVIY